MKVARVLTLLCFSTIAFATPALQQSSERSPTPPPAPELSAEEQARKLDASAVDLITPKTDSIPGVSKPPIVGRLDLLKPSATTLIVNLRLLVASAAGGQLSLQRVNTAFESYNNLVVLMGLTDPRQLQYFPRLNTIAQQLAIIKTQLSQ